MNNSLLLHVCCAGCLTKAVEAMKGSEKVVTGGSGDITLFFDNSNIHPRTEWVARLEAVKTVSEELELKLIVADWSPKIWYDAIGHDPDNTGLRRCKKCWGLRLGNTAELARSEGFGHFSSTLLSSKYQGRERIIEIGKGIEDAELKFTEIPIENSCSEPKRIYMQNYCGCVYSLVERYEEAREFKKAVIENRPYI